MNYCRQFGHCTKSEHIDFQLVTGIVSPAITGIETHTIEFQVVIDWHGGCNE